MIAVFFTEGHFNDMQHFMDKGVRQWKENSFDPDWDF